MTDVVVVGAGPAGMAAAVTLSECGLRPVVIDEQQAPGGQIFRQPPVEFAGVSLTPGAGYQWGTELIEKCRSESRIDWRFGTSVWAALRTDQGGLAVATTSGTGSTTLSPQRLLIATGAYDMPLAVPGWTLPGVLTAGAVQSLLKSQRLRAGRRFVLAGSHPLLLVVADQLLTSGAEIAEVAIARPAFSLSELTGGLRAVPGHAGLLWESAAAVRRLRKAGVPIRFATMLTGVGGDDQVESAHLSTVHPDDTPRGPARDVACDSVVLGYGFLPSTDLARQAGCNVQWQPAAGGWVVQHDDRMRSSVADIYVAGEPTGIAGAEQSRAEGVLAGLALAADLGALTGTDAAGRIARARQQLRRARRFSQVVQRIFPPPFESLATWTTDDTIVCRCELVTGGAVRGFLAENPHVCQVNAIKLECRTGMGPCQGRYCQSTVASIIARERDLPISAVGSFTAQAPVKPVSLRTLSQAATDSAE